MNMLIQFFNYSNKLVVVMTLACALVLSACAHTVPSQPAKASVFAMPDYEKYVLTNGLTFYLMPQKEVPLMTINAVIRAGSVNDTTAGLSGMTVQSLLLGANGKSKTEIELIVDSLGASIYTDAGKEGSYLGADFMVKDSDVMLPLVQSLLLSPNFDEVEFAKLLQREIAGLAQAKESPRSVISHYFDELIFGLHPYGNSSSGNRFSLAEINVAQLKTFYKRYYQPSNTAVTLVGDFDVSQMKPRLDKLFGQWQNAEPIVKVDLKSAQPTLDASQVLLVNKSDAIETTFLIGGKGIARDNPDYVGLEVINTVLGGRFTSWLNDELRVNAGLTYGARSGFTPYSEGGVFKISTFTKSETTKEAIDLALKTYARLWEKGIDQVTLDSAKAYVKGQFPPQFETNGQLASLLSDMYLYRFDDRFINDFQSQVDSLNLVEVQRLIREYFPQKHLQLVLIGNADKIATIAADYGEVTQVDIKQVGFGE